MPNKFKGKHQPKSRKSTLPANKPGQIIRRFLDTTPSEVYPGCLGNSEFVKALGYVRPGSIASLANSWMNGKPIPARTLIKIAQVYPEFPLQQYLKAYVDEFPESSSVLFDVMELTLMLFERHKKDTEELMDEYKTTPSKRPSSEHPEMLLEQAMQPFEEDWRAEKSVHESPDPSREDKKKNLEKFQKGIGKKA